jgi:hypothetical protein
LHRGDGVAGVDRPLEGVEGVDLDNVGNLPNIELGGDAWRDVLAVRCRRKQQVLRLK